VNLPAWFADLWKTDSSELGELHRQVQKRRLLAESQMISSRYSGLLIHLELYARNLVNQKSYQASER
jgi:hypothetical protein